MNEQNYSNKEFLTGKQFCEMLSIAPCTLSRWIKSGKIKVIRAGSRAPVHIPMSELQRLMESEQYSNNEKNNNDI